MLQLILSYLGFSSSPEVNSHRSLSKSSEQLENWGLSNSPEEVAARILQQVPLIDGHNDLPWQLRTQFHSDLKTIDLNLEHDSLHTDIPKLKKGKVGAQFWSVFVPCPYKDFHHQFSDAVGQTLHQIDLTKRMIEQYSNIFELATTPAQVKTIFSKGKIAALRQFFELGVRYVTLTHSCDNDFAYSCSTKGGKDGKGLTNHGIHHLIPEMNRLGMLVDISHVSHNAMRDVLKITKAPVIFSHSSAFAVCNHPRNVPDDVLRTIKEKNGIVMVNFYSGFVMCDGSQGSLLNVVEHVLHIVEVAGAEHVGFGADFDGVEQTPVGLENVSKYPDLVVALLKHGLNENQVRGIVGKNLLRVWEKVEMISNQWDMDEWTDSHPKVCL